VSMMRIEPWATVQEA